VLGEHARWVAALDRRDGSWQLAFEESCAPGPAAATPDA
jgi:hypothetical protein